MLKHMIH